MENRRARNEAFFREVNERIEAISSDFTIDGVKPERMEFVCECGKQGCIEMLEATFAEYEAVRAHSKRFLVLPGHEHTETARVIDRNNRFFVVEKLEEAGEVAIEHDPRS